ncbi:MAG: response regulator [Elusimicrobia bacterium]|nr:response regulator [Elusimicrobiota bacterium]
MANILLIDDEPDMRRALRQLLEHYGHQISEAGDGDEALRLVESQKPDLALLDLRLPGQDGVEILREIRREHPDLAIIMITGFSSNEAKMELERLGISAFLTKPFHNRDLAAAVHRTLEERRLLNEKSLHEQQLGKKLSPNARFAGSRHSRADEPPSPGYRALMNGRRLAPLILVMIAATAAYFLFQQKKDASVDFTIPFEHPSSIVLDKDNLWISDWLGEKIIHYKIAEGLSLERRYDLSGEHITGLAVAEGGLAYVCDSWKKTISKRRIEPDFALIETAPSPGPSPSCLFWDKKFLWSCDAVTGKIYQHDPSDLSVRVSFDNQAKSPTAVAIEDGFLWVGDAASNKIFKHRLGATAALEAMYSLPAQVEAKALSGMALHEGYFWLARDGSSILWKRSLKKLSAEQIR